MLRYQLLARSLVIQRHACAIVHAIYTSPWIYACIDCSIFYAMASFWICGRHGSYKVNGSRRLTSRIYPCGVDSAFVKRDALTLAVSASRRPCRVSISNNRRVPQSVVFACCAPWPQPHVTHEETFSTRIGRSDSVENSTLSCLPTHGCRLRAALGFWRRDGDDSACWFEPSWRLDGNRSMVNRGLPSGLGPITRPTSPWTFKKFGFSDANLVHLSSSIVRVETSDSR